MPTQGTRVLHMAMGQTICCYACIFIWISTIALPESCGGGGCGFQSCSGGAAMELDGAWHPFQGLCSSCMVVRWMMALRSHGASWSSFRPHALEMEGPDRVSHPMLRPTVPRPNWFLSPQITWTVLCQNWNGPNSALRKDVGIAIMAPQSGWPNAAPHLPSLGPHIPLPIWDNREQQQHLLWLQNFAFLSKLKLLPLPPTSPSPGIFSHSYLCSCTDCIFHVYYQPTQCSAIWHTHTQGGRKPYIQQMEHTEFRFCSVLFFLILPVSV